MGDSATPIWDELVPIAFHLLGYIAIGFTIKSIANLFQGQQAAPFPFSACQPFLRNNALMKWIFAPRATGPRGSETEDDEATEPLRTDSPAAIPREGGQALRQRQPHNNDNDNDNINNDNNNNNNNNNTKEPSNSARSTTTTSTTSSNSDDTRRPAAEEGPAYGPMAVCCLGLIGFYVTWGYFQERLMTTDYIGLDGLAGRFRHSEMLVLLNRVSACGLAMTAMKYMGPAEKHAPPFQFSYASLSNIVSSWFQYEALKFVSFPMQVLSKSSKILFTMVMGKVVSGKVYGTSDYGLACLITSGLALFMYYQKFDTQDGAQHSLTELGVGCGLLFGYVICDSFTSTWQSKIFQQYKISQYQMMLGINACSSTVLFVSLLAQGTLFSALTFLLSHPTCFFHAALMSVCSASGQLFIFYTIKRFGAVIFAGFMTVRQLFSILLSCYLFGHEIPIQGQAGISLVFLAMIIRVYLSRQKAKQKALAKRAELANLKPGK